MAPIGSASSPRPTYAARRQSAASAAVADLHGRHDAAFGAMHQPSPFPAHHQRSQHHEHRERSHAR